jgi:tRNA-dihydrouridine synthase 1
VGACDWKIIKRIKEEVNIPVFANGGIHTFKDVEACLRETGVDGVMSAEALLENPALFSGKVHCLDKLAEEYLDLWEKYDGVNKKALKPHLFKILHEGLREHKELRAELGQSQKIEEFRAVLAKMKELRKDVKLEDKFGWYDRYRNYNIESHNALRKEALENKGNEENKVDGEEPVKKVKEN